MNKKTVDSDGIKFSVIIPLYNKEHSIASTVRSVLDQTYRDFELIIVNDGSTDNSRDVVRSIIDKRIIIADKPNGGVSSARNRGIELSHNQYIVFLDADDFWFPFCLEEFSCLISEFNEAQVFCTNYNMTGKNHPGSENRYYVDDYYYTSAYFMAKWSIPIMLTGCVAVRRDAFNSIGYFNQDITHGEDIDMWLRLSSSYKMAKSERITTIYRTESENRASHKDEREKRSVEKEEIKRRNITGRSHKLYIGVQLVLDLMNINNSHDYKSLLINIIRFPDLFLSGVIFIIKARYLNLIKLPSGVSR
jgi:glycosyltransferase involved in cell wall biosynthesis